MGRPAGDRARHEEASCIDGDTLAITVENVVGIVKARRTAQIRA